MQVLVFLPDRNFDVTEVAMPWRTLREAGHEVMFATEHGASPAADPLLLTGVLFEQLGAEPEPRRFYQDLLADEAYQNPVPWADLDPEAYDGLLLPGDHAPGMRQYLGSEVLRAHVLAFWRLDRPVAALCHGVLVLARTVDPTSGRSVLADRRTTCRPKYLERTAYYLTAWRRGRYYRTYPAYMQDEVTAALDSPAQFERGPLELSRRDTATDDGPAFVMRDRNYCPAPEVRHQIGILLRWLFAGASKQQWYSARPNVRRCCVGPGERSRRRPWRCDVASCWPAPTVCPMWKSRQCSRWTAAPWASGGPASWPNVWTGWPTSPVPDGPRRSP
jgi:putative intracellular protease/amidase